MNMTQKGFTNMALIVLVVAVVLGIAWYIAGYPVLKSETNLAGAISAVTGATPATLSNETVNVKEFGAKGDARGVRDAAITAGKTTLTSATAAFTSTDVGKRVSIRGAAASGGGGAGDLSLFTKITGYTNPTTVTIAVAASKTVTKEALTIVTDDTVSFNNAQAALPAYGGVLFVPPGGYYVNNFVLSKGAILRGAGPIATALFNWEASANPPVRVLINAISDVYSQASRPLWTIEDMVIAQRNKANTAAGTLWVGAVAYRGEVKNVAVLGCGDGKAAVYNSAQQVVFYNPQITSSNIGIPLEFLGGNPPSDCRGYQNFSPESALYHPIISGMGREGIYATGGVYTLKVYSGEVGNNGISGTGGPYYGVYAEGTRITFFGTNFAGNYSDTVNLGRQAYCDNTSACEFIGIKTENNSPNEIVAVNGANVTIIGGVLGGSFKIAAGVKGGAFGTTVDYGGDTGGPVNNSTLFDIVGLRDGNMTLGSNTLNAPTRIGGPGVPIMNLDAYRNLTLDNNTPRQAFAITRDYSLGAGAAGIGSALGFYAKGASAVVNAVMISGVLTKVTAGSEVGDIVFSPMSGGNITDRFTIKGDGSLVLSGITFANLGTPENGRMAYCSDCKIANPCAGGGTGALAKRLNGVWVCN